MTQEAKDFIGKFGSWYIQFPRFTYLRVQGFKGCPYKLPRYPTNKMILLKVIKQLDTYEKIQRGKKKAGISFPHFVGKMLESCPLAQAANNADVEM